MVAGMVAGLDAGKIADRVADDDRLIIEQVLAGSEFAFRQLLDRHTKGISSYVRRMTRNSSEAEDIVQETFVRFWMSRDRFDPDRIKLTTWLHPIAHNLCIDSFRKSHHEANRYVEHSDNDAGPDANVELAYRAAQVHQALMHLPETQRSAIVLCHYQNFSQRDAAHILELSVDALETILRRGRTKLKESLAEELK
jgi:RNA polymerase sigma-70 factor (ECF subfamily)